MLGKIVEIRDDQVKIKMTIDIKLQPSLSNLHVVFEEDTKRIIGEIISIDEQYLYVNIVGEIVDNKYLPGVEQKPSFKAKVRIVNVEELTMILGPNAGSDDSFFLGTSSIYNNYNINVNTTSFFSNHFAIVGNSGSGRRQKSKK